MNGAQLHLALNHIPVVLSMAAAAVLIGGHLAKNSEIKKVGLFLVIAMAAFSVTAFLTGEPAEEVLKGVPNFPKDLAHEHEEAGEAALILSGIAGIGALSCLLLGRIRSQFASHFFVGTLLFVLISVFSFAKTGHLGGLIRHEEIR